MRLSKRDADSSMRHNRAHHLFLGPWDAMGLDDFCEPDRVDAFAANFSRIPRTAPAPPCYIHTEGCVSTGPPPRKHVHLGTRVVQEQPARLRWFRRLRLLDLLSFCWSLFSWLLLSSPGHGGHGCISALNHAWMQLLMSSSILETWILRFDACRASSASESRSRLSQILVDGTSMASHAAGGGSGYIPPAPAYPHARPPRMSAFTSLAARLAL